MTRKAPGKSNRISISLVDVLKMFPDNKAAEDWFTAIRWPNGVWCPYCESTNVQTGAQHRSMPMRCREKECGKRFSVRIDTIMQDSNLGYQTWAIALYLVLTSLKSVSSMKLHRDLGITQRSAWHLAHRLRAALTHDTGLFPGPVEVDETYIGGKRRNMHNRKRKQMKGRGGVGKATVVGAVDRDTGQVSARQVPATDAAELQGFVVEKARPGAAVYTDDASAYKGLRKRYRHESVNHSAGEYVRGMAHINGIESFWAMLKRGYHGTFHHFSKKHLQRYVSEFAARYNIRELDTLDQMAFLTAGMLHKRLRYKDLTA